MYDKKHSDTITEEVFGLRKRVTELEAKEAEHTEVLNKLQEHNDVINALNEILQISLLPIPLSAQLTQMLELIVNIPWITLEKKGCVFLVNKSKKLEMVAHLNLSSSLLSMCSKVPFGQCLCGTAAKMKKVIYKNHIDHEHTSRPKGMTPHGHYILPIIRNGDVIGIFNLYTEDGHEENPLELDFLKSVCSLVAGIIERKQMEDKLEVLSLSDSLTGLPNRRYMLNLIKRMLLRSKRYENKFALLFLDLDKFKPVNDLYGHDMGDNVLCYVAEKFKNCIRASDTVGRLGGDEFLIFIEEMAGDDDIVLLKNRLKKHIEQPIIINAHEIQIGVSIGISIYPTDGDSVSKLLTLADNRMYEDKKISICKKFHC